jgi:hypothetical protein
MSNNKASVTPKNTPSKAPDQNALRYDYQRPSFGSFSQKYEPPREQEIRRETAKAPQISSSNFRR